MWLRLFKLLAKAPLSWLHVLGAALGWVVYLLDPVYRRRLREHAASAGVDPAQARQSIGHMGRMILETPKLWCRPPDQPLGALARWTGDDLITPALATATRGAGAHSASGGLRGRGSRSMRRPTARPIP